MVVLDGRELRVAVADTASARSRGLMGVTDLGSVSGMLFTWGGETVTSGFTMRNTLIPLRIGFFSADGSLVDQLTMIPCASEPCPTYRAAGPYAYAIEVPVDGGVDFTAESHLTLGP